MQKLRRIDRTAAEDHLTPRFDLNGLTAAPIFHARGLLALKQDARNLSLGAQGDIGPFQGGPQESVGAGGAQALVGIDLIDANTLWRGAIEIIRMGKA